MRPWNCHRMSDSAYTHASLGGGHHESPQIPCFNEHWDMNGIWMVYERHVSSGGLLLFGGTLPGLPGLPCAPGRFGPGTSANIFGFDHWKSTNTRLGPAKVPQPGVDLVHMAASARALARAVSTPEFEGLLLSRSILASVWNGRRVIAMKKARKERHPPKKVLSYRCRDSGQERVHTANDHVIWVKYTIDIQIIYVIYDNLLLWMLIVWTHLNILVMKEMMIHVEGITPSPGCWKKTAASASWLPGTELRHGSVKHRLNDTTACDDQSQHVIYQQ